MFSFRNLQLTRSVRQGDVTYAKVLQNGRPMTLTTMHARVSMADEYDSAYIMLLDKSFETNIMLLENWLLGEVLSTPEMSVSPSCHFRSVIRQGTYTQKHSMRCKLDSRTKLRDSKGRILQKVDLFPNTIVECTIEVKCAYFGKDSFGLSFVLRELVAKLENSEPDVCLITP